MIASGGVGEPRAPRRRLRGGGGRGAVRLDLPLRPLQDRRGQGAPRRRRGAGEAAMKRGITLGPFGELADAALVAELAAEAEAAGYDGFFVWDHIVYTDTRDVADPWIVLSAIAMRTERVLLGPMVTPLARRRVAQARARDRHAAAVERRAARARRRPRRQPARRVRVPRRGGGRRGERAQLLDDGLDRPVAYWGGELQPAVARSRSGSRAAIRTARPLRRAARYDGLLPDRPARPGRARRARRRARPPAMRWWSTTRRARTGALERRRRDLGARPTSAAHRPPRGPRGALESRRRGGRCPPGTARASRRRGPARRGPRAPWRGAIIG